MPYYLKNNPVVVLHLCTRPLGWITRHILLAQPTSALQCWTAPCTSARRSMSGRSHLSLHPKAAEEGCWATHRHNLKNQHPPGKPTTCGRWEPMDKYPSIPLSDTFTGITSHINYLYFAPKFALGNPEQGTNNLCGIVRTPDKPRQFVIAQGCSKYDTSELSL